jgi:hypothetical protein
MRQTFDEIRRTYFPRWDRRRRWSFHVGIAPGMRRGSFCDTRAKAIYISPDDAESPGARASIIHEITHAVGHLEHDPPFQHRLGRAADRAAELGDTGLASQIRDDIEVCRRIAPRPTAEEVYALVREVVVIEQIHEYERVLDLVSDRYASTPEEFEKYHPRTRKVFEKALREAEREDQEQARVRARRAG